MSNQPVVHDCKLMGPVMPCLILNSSKTAGTFNASCPACKEEIYTDISELAYHSFYNWGSQAMWFSHVLKMEVHRCRGEQDWNIEELTREMTR